MDLRNGNPMSGAQWGNFVDQQRYLILTRRTLNRAGVKVVCVHVLVAPNI
jgi:hypothetical protein